MAKKTHEFYENELFEREINYLPLEKYVTAHHPILHQCINDHVWKCSPRNILNNKGCPYCAGNKKKTLESYKAELTRRPYEVLDTLYVNSKTPMLHKHKSCGHEWLITPDNILRGYGCPECGGTRKRTNEEYVELLKDTGYTVLQNYMSNKTPILHRHDCGYEFKVAPQDLLSKHTMCHSCSPKGGFQHNKPGYLYLVKFTYLLETYYKIGITNKDDLTLRFKSDWYKFNMKPIWIHKFSLGSDARDEETKILRKYKSFKQDTGLLINGNSETFDCHLPRELLELYVADHCVRGKPH
jgi:predicted  nucleic acid-binding Zn-ribbon protein